MIILIVLIVLFLGLAILFINGKGEFLIAGYNTMPDKEKQKYDTVRLCKFMGKSMFALTFSMIIWGLSDLFGMPFLFYVGLGIFLGSVVFMIVYMNSGNRFQKSSL